MSATFTSRKFSLSKLHKSLSAMLIFLLKFILLAISLSLNLIFKLIFSAAAYILVFVIQAFKVPGDAIQIALDQFGNLIRTCVEYLVELVTEAVSILISSFFDLLRDWILESITATGSSIRELMDSARTSFVAFLDDIPDLVEGFAEMIAAALNDLWNNYKDAAGFVTENV